jgi:hypothetical protein
MATLSFHLTGLKHTRLELVDDKGNKVMGTFIPDLRNDLKPTAKDAIYVNCWVNDINPKFLEVLKKNGQEATHSIQLRTSEEMGKKLKAWNEAHPDDKKFAPNLGVLDMGKAASGGADPSANAVAMSAPANNTPIPSMPDDDELPF